MPNLEHGPGPEAEEERFRVAREQMLGFRDILRNATRETMTNGVDYHYGFDRKERRKYHGETETQRPVKRLH